jgi:hypothetical protein
VVGSFDHHGSAVRYFRRRPEKDLHEIRHPRSPKGLLAKLQAGKPTAKIALLSRAAGMDDEVIVGGRHYHWYNQLTNEEILGPLPEPPSFSEDIAVVRDRVRKLMGKVSVPKALTAPHPAIARLIAQDDVRRQKQLTATYTFSWDAPIFDSPFEQRRLRFLNALFWRWPGAAASHRLGAGRLGSRHRCSPHRLSLDRPPAGRRKGAGEGSGGPDRLRLVILAGYDGQERAARQDGEGASSATH